MRSSTAILSSHDATVRLLSESQAAHAAGVSRKTIRRLIRQGRLRACDYGTAGHRLYRIHPADLTLISPAMAEDLEPITPPGRRSRARRSRPAASLEVLADLWP